METANQTVRRSQRSRERVDYKALQEGPPLVRDSVNNVTWSTKELFRLTVLDNRVDDDGRCFVKVHYIGWDKKYDEWRPASDVVDIPDCFLISSTEAHTLFIEQLKIAIKESLHCQRKTSAFIEVRVPIVKDIFDTFKDIGSQKGKNRFHIGQLSILNELHVLGEGWFYRIVNAAGDFTYIVKDTVEYWISERAPACGIRRRTTHSETSRVHI